MINSMSVVSAKQSYSQNLPPGSGGDINLATSDNLNYLGAFKVPLGVSGGSKLSYANGCLAYYPTNDSLFIAGSTLVDGVAEISIPTIVNDPDLANLNRGSYLQNYVFPFSDVADTTSIDSNINIGGLLVIGNALYGTIYEYYDGNVSQIRSHFIYDDASDLANANVSGLFRMGVKLAGYYSGYMSPIPSAHQSGLGNKAYITGMCGIPIIGRSSYGPAMFGFNASDFVNTSTTVGVQDILWYDSSNPLGDYNETNIYFNGNTHIRGCHFVPDKRSVFFFGDHGTGTYFYGSAADANDSCRGGKGSHSINGEYEFQVWCYDIDDLKSSVSGTTNPYSVLPYDVFYITLPFSNCGKILHGTAYDEAGNRLFISTDGETSGSEPYPVIHVFEFI